MKLIVFMSVMMGTALIILLSGFTLPTLIALIILVAAVSMDFLTTWKCLKRGRREGNPIVAFLFKKIGVPATFVLVACVWVCFIAFRWLGSEPGVQTAMAIAYWLVPVNNLMVLVRQVKRNPA